MSKPLPLAIKIELPNADNEIQTIHAVNWIFDNFLEDKESKFRILSYVMQKQGFKMTTTEKKTNLEMTKEQAEAFGKVYNEFFNK